MIDNQRGSSCVTRTGPRIHAMFRRRSAERVWQGPERTADSGLLLRYNDCSVNKEDHGIKL